MDFSPLNVRSKNLFKRCITCNPLTSASCPTCKADEDCTLIPATCEKCAEYTCIAASESGAVPGLTAAAPTHKAPVAPVIAGSVIGGVILISVGVWLIWKFALKGSRRDSVSIWEPAEFPMEKSGPNSYRSAATSPFSNDARSRASTHTYHSMASTVLTRASNVIQIAFIPGVTTRSSGEPTTTPRTLVPPVPPIPLPTSPLSRGVSGTSDLHFHPGQIRDSSYSTGDRGGPFRGSVASSSAQSDNASIARGSIASTIYGSSAVAVTPIKPSMISLKSMSSSPHTSTPPVPSPFSKSDSESPAGKSMIVQMPVSREKGELSAMPPSRVRSLRGLKPKAVMISKGKSVPSPAESDPTSASTSTPPPVPAISPFLATLPEEHKSPLLPSSSSLANPRVHSVASDATHTRARHVEDFDSDDDDISDHERSRRSLIRKNSASGPFSDSAAVSPDADAIKPAVKSNHSSSSHSHLSPFNDAHEL